MACLEAFLVHGAAFLLQDLFGQIQREAVGIVELERIFSSESTVSSFCLHICFHDLPRMLKPWSMVLLNFSSSWLRTLKIIALLLFQLRITVLGDLDNGLGQLCQELSLDAKQIVRDVLHGGSDGAVHSLVPHWMGMIPSEIMKVAERDMVGDQTDRNILLVILLIVQRRASSQTLSRRALMVSTSKHGIHILNDHCQTLQTHTGIDVLLLQLGVIAVAVVVELGEYVVPYLHVTVALTAYGTARFAAAVFLSAVIVDLRTGTAGTCAMLPEVVLFAEAEDTLRREYRSLCSRYQMPHHRPGKRTDRDGPDPVLRPRSGTPRTSGWLHL